jgi:putative transposase
MIHALLLIAHWIGEAHDRWRDRAAFGQPLRAEADLLRDRLEKLRAENRLLRERLLRLHPRRRPHYLRWQRLAVLWHAARYGLSIKATARAFVVTRQTIVNWHRDVRMGLARLVQARTPLNRLPDLVEAVARRLKREWPDWGSRRIAGLLAKLGLRGSRSTVQRLLQGRRPRRRAVAQVAARTRGPLVPKRPGHMLFIDFTRVRRHFRSVWIGAVIDGFSRKVLAIRACLHPSAAAAVALMREAIYRRGESTWVISDRDPAFTSGVFTRLLHRHGLRRRFGAIGRKATPARIERFWRTLKEEYAGDLFLYRPLKKLDRDLARYARWYNRERPHEGLRLRTPDDAYFERKLPPARRMERGELTVRFHAGDRRLPVLRLRRVA